MVSVLTAGASNNWSDLCDPKKVDLSQAKQEYVKSVKDLGDDWIARQWQVLDTQYHRVYYDSSIDHVKLAHVAGCLDNLYEFLQGWFPTRSEVPIRTFLIPNQYAHSRCSFKSNAMRTGDKGNAVTMITSLLHEEVHLFNFSYLGKPGQGWWAGEFSCLYFQNRLKLEAMGKDVRGSILAKLPNGPGCHFGKITDNAKQRFEQAFSAMYFLHTAYGDHKFCQFRIACLRSAKENLTRTGPDDSLFGQCFGKSIDELDRQWRAFYGWKVEGEQQRLSVSHPVKPANVIARVVVELTSPVYEGRAAGSSGERRAGRFIMSQFRELDLSPVGRNSNYLHHFNVAYRDLIGPIGLRIRGHEFTYKSDFGVLQGGPTEWTEGRMHFIGYGSSDNISDIDTKELKGKVLVAAYKGKRLSNTRNIQTLAEQTKAAAVLLVDTPSNYKSIVFHRKNTRIHNTVPVLHVSPAVGEFILSGTDHHWTDVCRNLVDGRYPNLNISGVCRLAAGTVYIPGAASANVIGMFKAAPRTNYNGIFFAHYDGQGRDGESGYYPSANDNASGVAVLLAIASLLRQQAPKLAANVYFAALGAEEVGMIGARALRADKALPWEKMDFAICLDMVGHSRGHRLTVQTTGTDEFLYQAFSAYANRQGWQIRPIVRNVLGSDAGVIQRGGIPTLFILTGDNKQHTVDDDSGNTDSRHMEALSELLAGFVLASEFRPGTFSRQKTVSAPKRYPADSAEAEPTTNVKVTFSSEKISVQFLIRELAHQAGLSYDWAGSQEQVGEFCRRWIRDVNIVEVPLPQALDSVLKPLGLTYTIHDRTVLLKHASKVSPR